MQTNRRKLFLSSAVAVLALGAIFQMLSGKPQPALAKSAASLPKTSIVVPKNREVATLAAGCFWSMEAMFKQLKGVEKVVPGYAGGHVKNPSYERVCDKNTGHAEAIQVTYDPKVISYRQLLQVLLIARNPTTLNLQEPDDGPEYRSAIFAQNAEQKAIAQQAIKEVDASHVWPHKIVTAIEPFSNFYSAENYHFNYYNLHPDQPYCKFVIAPEIAKFRNDFKGKLKS